MELKKWDYGTAKVLGVRRDCVTVLCPHCNRHHQHPRLSLGSREVVAGCHKGFTICRSYAIPVRSR